MSTIHFEAKLFNIGAWTLLRLPESASAKLPSRGMTMVEGTINGFRFQAALEPDLTDSPQVHKLWMDITPMARWDWIRWIRATKQPETRKRRIEVACSKLKAGTRRPCCFNRNLCTEPSVSNNGVLLEPREL